jgi:hypothetical protein
MAFYLFDGQAEQDSFSIYDKAMDKATKKYKKDYILIEFIKIISKQLTR